MKQINPWILVMLVLAGLTLSACGPKAATAENESPYQLEEIEGVDFKRVTLTEKAAERLDIQTGTVSMTNVNGNEVKMVPYAAVLYGLNGETWVYTNPEGLVYVRDVIVVDHIDDDMVILEQGPEAGTPVVTVGVSLLYGAEVGVSK